MTVCLLENAVVIDTSSIPILLRTVYQSVTGYSDFRVAPGTESAFIDGVSDFLRKLAGCALQQRLITSTLAYDNEINPGNPTWLSPSMQYMRDLLANDEHRGAFSAVLRDQITQIPSDEASISLLQVYLRDEGGFDLSRVDCSLILLGLRKSQDGNSTLVTEDQDLLDALQWLNGRRHVRVGPQSYRSIEPLGRQLVEVSRSVHGCCQLESDLFCEVLGAFFRHLRDRQQIGALPPAVLEAHVKRLGQVQAYVLPDCDLKRKFQEQAAITAELEKHFLKGESE